MEMTKKEFITLLREDMREQRKLVPGRNSLIRINNIALYDIKTLKLRFGENYITIFRVYNEIEVPIAHVWYSDINSIGYKYRSIEQVERCIAGLRRLR